MAENKKKADGQVLIDTKINTEGAEKDLDKLKQGFAKGADAAEESVEKIEKSFKDIDTSNVADGLGDSFKRESAKAETYLDGVADAAQEAAREQAEAFEDAWDDAADSARRASNKIKDDIDDIEDAAQEAGEEIEDKLGGGFESLVKGFAQGVIGGIVGGVTGAVVEGAMDALEEVAEAAIEFGKESLEISSNLEEVQNVVDTVFPNMASRVNAFAESALESAGLSELAAKQIIGQFGSMAAAAGMTEQAAYDMATGLAQATGDVASFYNLSIDESYQKLQAIFTGETEPLRSLGINMNEETLLAYALSEGLIDTSKSAEQLREETIALERAQLNLEKTQASHNETLNQYEATSIEAREASLDLMEANQELAEAQAALNAENKPSLDNLKGMTIETLRYQFVMSRLEKTQGDFVKTQKSWANQTKILDEQWKEFQGTIGDGLKEELRTFVQVLNDEVMPGLQTFAEEFAEAMKPTPAEELNEYMRSLSDSVENAGDRFRETAAELQANAIVAENLVKRLEELEEAGVNNNIAATEYEAIVKRLNELFPGLNAQIDENTGLLKEGTEAIWDRIEALKEQAKQEAIQEYIKELYELEIDAVTEIAEARAKLSELQGLEAAAIQQLADQYGVSYEEMEVKLNNFYKKLQEGWPDMENTAGQLFALGETVKAVNFEELTQQFVNAKNSQIELNEEIANATKNYAELSAQNEIKIKQLETTVKEFNAETGKVADGTKDLERVEKNLATAHGWLSEEYENLTQTIVDHNDKVSDATKEYYKTTVKQMENLLSDMDDLGERLKTSTADSADGIIEEWNRVITKYYELMEILTGGGISVTQGNNPEIGYTPRFIGEPSADSLVDTSIEPALAAVDPVVSDSSIPYLMSSSYTVPYSAMAMGEIMPPNAIHTASFPAASVGSEEIIAGVMDRVEVSMGETGSEILSALNVLISVVQGINVGDDTIGQAAQRYTRKMNTARGVW